MYIHKKNPSQSKISERNENSQSSSHHHRSNPTSHNGVTNDVQQMFTLQSTIGNKAVTQMFSKPDTVQRSILEEEELQMKKDTDTVQRSILEEEELQMKKNTDTVQRSETGSGSSQSMPEHTQQKMEHALDSDFSNVKISEGNHAEEIGALAYTQGEDIHFAPGMYDPESQSGQELLGHELTHVVQQRAGRVQATTQAKGVPVNDDVELEKEADQMGKKAANINLDSI